WKLKTRAEETNAAKSHQICTLLVGKLVADVAERVRSNQVEEQKKASSADIVVFVRRQRVLLPCCGPCFPVNKKRRHTNPADNNVRCFAWGDATPAPDVRQRSSGSRQARGILPGGDGRLDGAMWTNCTRAWTLSTRRKKSQPSSYELQSEQIAMCLLSLFPKLSLLRDEILTAITPSIDLRYEAMAAQRTLRENEREIAQQRDRIGELENKVAKTEDELKAAQASLEVEKKANEVSLARLRNGPREERKGREKQREASVTRESTVNARRSQPFKALRSDHAKEAAEKNEQIACVVVAGGKLRAKSLEHNLNTAGPPTPPPPSPHFHPSRSLKKDKGELEAAIALRDEEKKADVEKKEKEKEAEGCKCAIM
ncbi:MAG: hypothetical protein BJ554DRAFT_1544, partial [Olpidium bornovanus]